jgi:hypothetical protein
MPKGSGFRFLNWGGDQKFKKAAGVRTRTVFSASSRSSKAGTVVGVGR